MLALDNPTILVITDRNDLDDQLFDTFAASTQLLRQEPRQVVINGFCLKAVLGAVSFVRNHYDIFPFRQGIKHITLIRLKFLNGGKNYPARGNL
jgi:hypothetical protein